MDVKIVFLNGELSEDIYMDLPEGYIIPRKEHMVCKLNRSIYGLKQASENWNKRFDQVITYFGFEQNYRDACVYMKVDKPTVAQLVLYVDDILLMGMALMQC